MILTYLFISTCYAKGKINVVSYNMGQLRKLGLDFVPCTSERLPHQISAIFKSKTSPIYSSDIFIMGLQEVWTEEAFKSLRFESYARNFSVFPTKFSDVQWNGLVTITNKEMVSSKTHYYKDSDYRYKSFLHTKLKTKSGKVIEFINTHTDFSTWGIINSTHLSQIKELSSYVRGLEKKNEVVLVGDFNMGPHTFDPKKKKKEKKKLWFEKIFPELQKMRLIHLNITGYSWNMGKNLMALKSTFILNIYNFLLHATINWEEKNEKIDHIFVSKNLVVSKEGLVFDKPAKFKCFGRSDRFGKAALSDHYGIMATLELL